MNFQKLQFQELTRLNEDSCSVDLLHNTSLKPGYYNTKNFRNINCKKNKQIALNVSLAHPEIIHNDGYGISLCDIDTDSRLRNAHNLTNLKNINQLYERPYLTTPYMGRGIGDICKETKMNPGESTMQKRPCNNLAGIHIDRFDTQVPCIKRNIQNSVNIIPEDTDNNWVRGGQDSRQLIRNKNYLKQCGYRYNNKLWSK